MLHIFKTLLVVIVLAFVSCLGMADSLPDGRSGHDNAYDPCSLRLRMPERISPPPDFVKGRFPGENSSNDQDLESFGDPSTGESKDMQSGEWQKSKICVVFEPSKAANMYRVTATRQAVAEIISRFEQNRGGASTELQAALQQAGRFKIETETAGSANVLDCKTTVVCKLTAVRMNEFRNIGGYSYTPELDLVLTYPDDEQALITVAGDRMTELKIETEQLGGNERAGIGDGFQRLIKKAMEAAAKDLKKRFPMRGKVFEVGPGENQLLLDLGKAAGVRHNDVYVVATEGQLVTNSSTGRTLRKPPVSLAIVQVDDFSEIHGDSQADVLVPAHLLKIRGGYAIEQLSGLDVFEVANNFREHPGICVAAASKATKKKHRRWRH